MLSDDGESASNTSLKDPRSGRKSRSDSKKFRFRLIGKQSKPNNLVSVLSFQLYEKKEDKGIEMLWQNGKYLRQASGGPLFLRGPLRRQRLGASLRPHALPWEASLALPWEASPLLEALPWVASPLIMARETEMRKKIDFLLN